MTVQPNPAASRADSLIEAPARFSVAEFMAIAESGIFPEGAKIELVEGVITRMSPTYAPHLRCQRQIFLALHSVLPDGLIAQFELSVRLGENTVREADVAVQRDPGPITGLHDPATVLLIVEIADTSLERDLHAKRVDYARAGIPHYWVVDLTGQRIHIMTAPLDGDYTERRLASFGDALPVPGVDKTISIG